MVGGILFQLIWYSTKAIITGKSTECIEIEIVFCGEIDLLERYKIYAISELNLNK